MAETEYPIATSADEFERLTMQADLFRGDAEAMLAEIGEGGGLKVLDMCSGIGGITDVLSRWVGPRGEVIGLELDAAKIDHARAWAERLGLDNVRFVQGNAFDSGLPPASFDLVHSRFAISVIQNGLGILDHMLTLVGPGGVLFLEEVNTASMQCAPPNADWDRALTLMQATFSQVGADTLIGPSLYPLLIRKGLRGVRAKPCVHALGHADAMTMHLPDTLAAMREVITGQGLMPAEELDPLIARVRAHLSRPDTLAISFTALQLVGRLS